MATITQNKLYASRSSPSAARRDVSCNFCPMCITAAIVANGPTIVAAVGGLAASAAGAKVAMDKADKRHAKHEDSQHHGMDAPVVARMVVDRKDLPPVTFSFEEY